MCLHADGHWKPVRAVRYFCVQDDNIPGRFIKINSNTGAYEYNDCSKGVS